MAERLVDLQKKEVINILDGKRLGFLYDVEIDLQTGKIGSVIVPGRYRFFGLFGRGEEHIISYEDIKKVGDDIILVEYRGNGVKF